MLKITLKLIVLVLLMLGASTLISGDSNKVYASTRCPNSFQDAQQNLKWGVTPQYNGNHGGSMAGMIIHAYDASNGQELDARYHLRSQAYGDAPHYENVNGHQTDLNDRIFKDINGNFSDRINDYQGFTNEIMYDTTSGSLYDSFWCHGWSAFAPTDILGDGQNVGNAYVLDCGPDAHFTRFWFSSISNPFNDGQNGQNGHWSLQIVGQNGTVNINNFTESSMSYLGAYFRVTNGSNTLVNMIWHPDPPQPPPPPSGNCSNMTVRDDGGHNGNHTYVDVTISGTNNDQNAYHIGYQDGHTFGYRAISPIISIQRVRYENRGSPTTPNWQVYENTTQRIECYHASCSVTQVLDGRGPNGSVIAGQPFRVQVQFVNDNTSPDRSTIPSAEGGYSFSMTEAPENGHSWIFNPVGYDLPVGASSSMVISQTAPSSPQVFGLNFVPDMYGHGAIGTGCSVSVPIYQEFGIEPRVSLTNTDPENPTTVSYTAGGRLTKGPATTANITSSVTKKPYGGTEGTLGNVDSTNETYGDIEHTYTKANPVINAGDEFSCHVTINPASGYAGPPGYAVLGGAPASRDIPCLKTVNKPYTHFSGNDVMAGGGFGNSCQKTQKGVIYAYTNAPNGPANGSNAGGTGAQFGAHAMDIISGLGTASSRTTAPTGLSGLAFANKEHIGGSDPSKTTGGFMGDAALSNFCVPDYFGDKPTKLASDPTLPLTSDTSTTAQAGAGAAQQWHKVPTGGTLTLNGGTIGTGVNQAIFVEGNVRITGNITYNPARASVKDIPSFYLIVKNGNIQIDPGVTQLDGVYVAQPDTTSAATTDKTGIINTCYIGADFNGVYNRCKNQLVVNGAFVANRVLLARSYSSLRYSKSGENSQSGAHNCGNADKDVPAGSTSAPDCAAEIFNFSPELYMSQPAINARFGAPTGKFDAITSLSPVL